MQCLKNGALVQNFTAENELLDFASQTLSYALPAESITHCSLALKCKHSTFLMFHQKDSRVFNLKQVNSISTLILAEKLLKSLNPDASISFH